MVETRSRFPRWRGRDGRSAAAPVVVSDEEEIPSSGRPRQSSSTASVLSSEIRRTPRGREAKIRLPCSQAPAEVLLVALIGTQVDASLLHVKSSRAMPRKTSPVSGVPGTATTGEKGETGADWVELGKLSQACCRASRGYTWATQARSWLLHMDEGEGGAVRTNGDESTSRGRRVQGCKESGGDSRRLPYSAAGASITALDFSEGGVGSGAMPGATVVGVEEEEDAVAAGASGACRASVREDPSKGRSSFEVDEGDGEDDLDGGEGEISDSGVGVRPYSFRVLPLPCPPFFGRSLLCCLSGRDPYFSFYPVWRGKIPVFFLCTAFPHDLVLNLSWLGMFGGWDERSLSGKSAPCLT